MNIQYEIGKEFGYIERAYSTGVNYYFGPKQTNRPHAIPKFGSGKYNLKLVITDRHIVIQKSSS